MTYRFNEIPESTRGSHEDIASTFYYPLLLLRTQATDHTSDTDSGWTFGFGRSMGDYLVEVIDHLNGEFSRWT